MGARMVGGVSGGVMAGDLKPLNHWALEHNFEGQGLRNTARATVSGVQAKKKNPAVSRGYQFVDTWVIPSPNGPHIATGVLCTAWH